MRYYGLSHFSFDGILIKPAIYSQNLKTTLSRIEIDAAVHIARQSNSLTFFFHQINFAQCIERERERGGWG